MEYILYFDGCCKGNPGPGGSGSVLYKNNEEIQIYKLYLPKTTNNIAEYTGLLIGLNGAIELDIKNLLVRGDSKLVISQLNGDYTVKSENLKGLYKQIKELEKHFDIIKYEHVYRKDNSRADELSNNAFNLL